jgi:hypothetical protein
MKIAYEPHPVSPERKAELRAQGYKIIDARFEPIGDVAAVGADAIHPLDHDGDGVLGGSLPDGVAPRKRGRPKKDAE